MHLRTAFAALGLSAMLVACHSETENVPLSNQNIYFTDKFYDVKALSPDRALIIGYGGKMLETADGGATFQRIDSGTHLALYKAFVRGNRVWVVGQEGLILYSADGGKTWQKQNSGTKVYLFSVFFINDDHGFAVGDKATLTETTDGGKTWKAREIASANEGADSEFALAMQDPVLYDIRFTSEQTGWIAGEFGHLMKTTDGGQTWTPHQASLMTPESGITDPMDLPTFFGEFMISDQEGFAAGIDGKIARTKDGGTTWRFEPMKLAYPLVDPLYQPYVTPDNHAWAIGGAGEVLQLEPGQTEWTRADMGMPLFIWMRGIDFADAQHGWLVGGYGTVLRTNDGGKTWTRCFG